MTLLAAAVVAALTLAHVSGQAEPAGNAHRGNASPVAVIASASPTIQAADQARATAKARAEVAAKMAAEARAKAAAKAAAARAKAKAVAKAKARAKAAAAAAAQQEAQRAAAQQQSVAIPAPATPPTTTAAPVRHVTSPIASSVMTAAESAAAYAVLSMLNSERAAHGLRTLRMNSSLLKSARAHNLMMAKYNTMSHQLPGEPYFTDRIGAAGYRWHTAGENVGWNSDRSTGGATYLEQLMYNEVPPNDGHRQNILNSSYVDVGVDIYFDAAHGKLWLTEDFGSPA